MRLLYYCNIRFTYRIKKVVENITINILGHKRKKNERDELVMATRGA